ncbi:MAG: hypothetical protein ACOYXU_13420 [Nitrospirota bacterium]
MLSSAFRLIALTVVASLAACAAPPSPETIFGIQQRELDDLKLAYYSDYVSFIGRDSQGIVAFALDTNRGRDQDTWQADHFVVLYDEQTGWQPIRGNGPYPNDSHQLETIPDSPHFGYRGTPQAWWHIRSPTNSLDLHAEPVQFHIDRQQGLAKYRLGSAGAALTLGNRVIEGRIIYEYLFLPGFNRLSRRYVGSLKGFHGLYLAVDGGAGDLYLHRQSGQGFSPLIGQTDGFLALAGMQGPLSALTLDLSATRPAIGFYRWPAAWQGTFTSGPSPYTFRLELSERHQVANWLVGGFAMGLVRGTLDTPDGPKQLIGLGELII